MKIFIKRRNNSIRIKNDGVRNRITRNVHNEDVFLLPQFGIMVVTAFLLPEF
ncbi:hypothetical protein [Mammaliicoccus sciuri]|uniref:hypothetical protein n=1 Tax=Mammaliicoccus sciuri TaxID=1296 RepID=UPI001299560A|nr:hypothetical protein [Mammaliicoccus sciuri]MRE71068.1 hypothetical protein [Mammaliicoccus sciuri]